MSDRTPLQDWIETATFGLPPSAVSKIGAEIADHAAESRGKHLAEGMNADEADAASVRDLGDARQLAVIFRDAHFSRREYTRGMTAALALLVIAGVGMLLSALSERADVAGSLNIFRQWVWLWDMVSALVGSILIIITVRVVLTFLREQYDIHVSRWGWWFFVACMLAAMPYVLAVQGLRLGQDFNPSLRTELDPALMRALYGSLPALQAPFAARYLVIGALAIGFCIRRLPSLNLRRRPVLAMLVILSGLIGVGAGLAGGTIFVSMYLPLPYPDSVPFLLFTLYLSSVFSILTIPLIAAPLGLLGYMRRPGAVVAG